MLKYFLSLGVLPLLTEIRGAILSADGAVRIRLEGCGVRWSMEWLDYMWHGEAQIIDLDIVSFSLSGAVEFIHLRLKLLQMRE